MIQRKTINDKLNKKIFILFLFISMMSFSQENEIYQKVVSQFEANYNDGNYRAIYNQFNYSMKKALPVAKTEAFFTDLKNKLGNITEVDFTKIKKEQHLYKITFISEDRDLLFSLDQYNRIRGLLVTYHKPLDLKVIERNTTKIILPFKDEWSVFWGGVTEEQNYHVAYENQQYAYDMLIMKDNVSFSGDAKKNESYFVYGKEIIAPCDAKVVKVITGVADNIPGELNPEQLTGNTIVLETSKEEYLLFAHLKENSITVREGQFVRQGSVMAKCGNSGNTTEPHLHLSLQNHADMNISTGGKLYFNQIIVNGEMQQDYLPVKGDLIKNRN